MKPNFGIRVWFGVCSPCVLFLSFNWPAYGMLNTISTSTIFPDQKSRINKIAQTTQPPPVNPKTDINRERLLQPIPTPLPSPQEPPPKLTAPEPKPEPSQPSPSISIKVNKIKVVGSTVFGAQDLAPITQPLEGRNVTLEELRNAADAISQLYIKKGYITSRAVLVNQTITNGVVEIRVIEGRLEKIEVEGTRRLNQTYVSSRIQRAVTTPLNSTKLEEQLRLLQLDPLFKKVEGSLSAGSTIDQSILTVRVAEAPTFAPGVSFDNYSPSSVGAERFGVSLDIRNPTGYGDILSASYNRTFTGGVNLYNVSYRVPLNSLDGTLQFRFSGDTTRVTDSAFEVLGIKGDSQIYEISFRQPIFKTFRREFALSLGFSVENKSEFFFGIPISATTGTENGESRTRVLRFGQDFISRDTKGAWVVQSQFNFGLGVLDATLNDDPTPDGRFFSWQGQVQRIQNLGKDNLLIIGGEIQLTPDSLFPSQQFFIGGGQLVRGYRQNARFGDNGFRFSTEARLPLFRSKSGTPIFQIAPFFDAGVVWNHPGNPNTLTDQTFLAGIGLGLLFEPIRGLNLRLDYGYPLINLRDRGDNLQDSGFYFSLNYQF
jgi:hemolysin activation/secretion protein